MGDHTEYERELGLTMATVPTDAAPGKTVAVKLANGLEASYVVPEGAKPGQQLPVRQLPPTVDQMTIEIFKENENTVLGTTMKGHLVKSGPTIVECDPGGLGASVLKAGDELIALRGVSKTSSFNQNLIGGAPFLLTAPTHPHIVSLSPFPNPPSPTPPHPTPPHSATTRDTTQCSWSLLHLPIASSYTYLLEHKANPSHNRLLTHSTTHPPPFPAETQFLCVQSRLLTPVLTEPHSRASELIKSAIGKLTIDIKRSRPGAPVVPILTNGMLSKRSPKALIGIHAWQSRYFELSPGRITYYEFVLITEGVIEPIVVRSPPHLSMSYHTSLQVTLPQSHLIPSPRYPILSLHHFWPMSHSRCHTP